MKDSKKILQTWGGNKSKLHSMQAVIPGIITLVFPLKPKKISIMNHLFVE